MSKSDVPLSLEELLAQAAAGDEHALTELLQRYEPRLRLAAKAAMRPWLRHRVDSIDLVQSVHRALLPALRDGRYEFESEDQLLGLAVTILRRKVLKTSERARREPSAEEKSPDVADPSDPKAEDPSLSAELKDQVRRLLGELPDEDRQIVELRLAGLSNPEIAEKLGTDAHALRARLSRLRRRLRELGLDEWV